jgi:hypothetical protein
MKKLLIVGVIAMIVLGLSTAFYIRALVPIQKDVWNRFGSGFELSGVQSALPAPVQKEGWNRFGSGFELSSVRTAAEIKASIQKYMWNDAGSGFELSGVPGSAQK